MSASQFIASLVSSLAWPAVVVAILVIFRRQFGIMLDRLSRLRLGAGQGQDADGDWERTEETLRQSLSAVREPARTGAGPEPAPTAQGARPRRGLPAADSGPRALIDDRWNALEEQLRNVVRPVSPLGAGELAGAGFDTLLDIALQSGLLTATTVRSLDSLRQLRNLARADGSLTARRAQDFALMTDAVIYGMRTQPGPG